MNRSSVMYIYPRRALTALKSIGLGVFLLPLLVSGTPSAGLPAAAVASAPSAQMEGLLICNFEQDISIWQGYVQDTETVVRPEETPPQGYLNIAKFHAKYTDRWAKPSAGFASSQEQVKEGAWSGKWENTVENNRVVAVDIPHDWTGFKYLSFWAFSASANKAAIELVAYSEDDKTSDDDYYKFEVVVDWAGWRKFEIPLKEFAATRTPVGWNKVDYFKIASSGWSHNPAPTTVLYFDAMRLSNERTEIALTVKLTSQHPNLLLNPSEIAEIKQKIVAYPWAKTAYQSLSANAFAWSTRSIVLPETGGGYYHAGGEDYQITQAHYDLSGAARDLGLMFQLSGERRFADKSKEILLAYAAQYLGYQIHDKEGRTGAKASAGGRATAQGINEAAWAIPLTWAYDLIYDTLSPAERERIEKQVLRPAAELLMDNNEGRHNHQSWYNAGIGVIGFALADPELVDHALNKAGSGFFYQMKNSVTPDGMQYEGSMHYQFYVLQAVAPLAEAAYHAGIDLYQEPGYRALFDFPILYADTTLRLPVINDGREVYLGASDRSRYYEVAFRRWGDPRYGSVLRASDRTSLEALVFGAGDLKAAPMPWISQDFRKSGLAVLRAGTGFDAKQVVLNYMGYAGGHSHSDQLGIVLFGVGRTLAPDSGSIKYEDPMQAGWYVQSIAHNVVLVNGKTLARAPVGALDAFAGGNCLQIARASNGRLYTGENLSRTLLLNSHYLVDLFRVDSTVENTYDWVYHNYGRFSTNASLQPAPQVVGKANGYEQLTNVQAGISENAWRADWLIASDQHVRLYMAGAPGTQVIAAEGLIAATAGDETASNTVPVVIARRQGKGAQYIAIVEPYSAAPVIDDVTPIAASADQPVSPQDAVGLQVHRGSTTDLLLTSRTMGVRRFGDITLDGHVAWVSRASSGIQCLYLGAGTRLSGTQWSVDLETLVTAGSADQTGVLIERAAPNGWQVRNAGAAAAIVTIAGLVPGNLQGYVLDDQDNRGERIRPIESSDGRIRFFLNPGAAYEIEAAIP